MNKKQKEARTFKFNIGADPEFNVTIQNKRANANLLFDTILNKDFTQNGNGMGYTIKNAGNIGWDGASETGEVRPKQSTNPQNVINNLATIFSEVAKRVQLFDLTTLSHKGPVGGHIHFEISTQLAQDQTLMRKFHRRMAAFYLPLMMGEDVQNLKIRHRVGSYGSITDHRVQKFGNAYTYEFRVPSAEWLTTPKIALSTLAYLGTVFHEILHHPNNFLKCKEILFTNDQQAKALHEMTLSNFAFATKAMTKHIKKMIQKFEYYPAFKDEINFILNHQKVLAEKQKAEFNILKGWKLIDTTTPNKRDLLNDKKIKTISLAKDVESIGEFIKMNKSNDLNVEHFTNILKQRIIALNWKLKNTYFFFGLRNGINDFMILNGNNRFLMGIELIKTYGDAKTTAELFARQLERVRVNPNINKVERKEILEKTILFGIPYKERVENNYRKFIEIIHGIEKGIIKAKELLATDNFPSAGSIAEEGKIFKAMTTGRSNNPAVRDDEELRIASRLREETEGLRRETIDPSAEDFDPIISGEAFNAANRNQTFKNLLKVEKQLNRKIKRTIKYLCAE